MRKIIVLSFITLDGVMQAPGGPEEDPSGGFNYGGWVGPYFDEEAGKVMEKQLKPADYLLGRKTFEIFADYWPEHNDFWPSINANTKYVLSNNIKSSEWNNSVFIKSVEDIQKLKNSGRTILMVGDGLNDAGALKESHVGITIADNVYHFSPACDGILDSDRFQQLPDFIHFSHTAIKVVRAGFIISFIYNIIGISFAASGLLTPLISAILMPLSSVTAVAFATFATLLLARQKHIYS